MALDGIAAVHARIQAIEQQLAGVAGSTTAAPARSGASSSTDFASMLSSAIGTQTAPGSTDLASSLGAGTMASGVGSSTDLSALLARVTGSAAPPATGTPGFGTGLNPTAVQFVNTALSQSGKPYVWGSSASPSDASPLSFDCSELTKWAAARSGLTIPDGAAHQYVWLKEQGATMTVQQALQTPGALLFSFAGEPQPGLAGEPAHAHVAISLGNGKTIEARGHAYGVGVFDAGNRFNYAGMIPGTA